MNILALPASLRQTLCLSPSVCRFLTTKPLCQPQNDQEPFTLPNAHGSPNGLNNLLSFNTTTLNSYTASIPPNASQLKYANNFFRKSTPIFLFSATEFRTLPPSSVPEIAIIGRSNVGKSSLINTLYGIKSSQHRENARTSSQPGKTQAINGYGIMGPGNVMGPMPKDPVMRKTALWRRFPVRGSLVVVDLPGYGHGSRVKWLHNAMKYFAQRTQLRKIFVLVDAEHGLKDIDAQVLVELRKLGVQVQVVLSKVDKMISKREKKMKKAFEEMDTSQVHSCMTALEEIKNDVRAKMAEGEGIGGRSNIGDILCCSAQKSIGKGHNKIGIDELRWTMLCACGLESDQHGRARKRVMQSIDILDDEEEA